MKTVFLLVDTNIALHYLRPDQINWFDIIEADKIVLIASPVFIRELENQKIYNPSKKLRSRARDYISWLYSFIDDPSKTVRKNVSWEFLHVEPQINFAAEQLRSDISDDSLIASALHCVAVGYSPLSILTADLGVVIKARARGLDVLRIPGGMRQPDEKDAVERDNESLRNQLAAIQSREPVLKAHFGNRETLATISWIDTSTIGEPPPIAEVKKLYLMIDPLSANSALAAEERAYNKQLQRYFDQYQGYLQDFSIWLREIEHYGTLNITVSNLGKAPATNIDLYLYFPPDVEPLDGRDFPAAPTLPKLPTQPLATVFRRQSPSPLSIQEPQLTSISTFSTSFEIEDGAVRFRADLLKHGFTTQTGEILLRVKRPDLSILKIRSVLSAAELSDLPEEELEVNIVSRNETQRLHNHHSEGITLPDN